jgi:hypothetical protein
MCSLYDECTLERYRWAEDTYRCRHMHLVNLLQNPCTLYRRRGLISSLAVKKLAGAACYGEDRGMSLSWAAAGKDACAQRSMAGVPNSKQRRHAEADFLASRQIHHDEISRVQTAENTKI